MEEQYRAKHVSLVATPDVIAGTLVGLYDVFNCFGALAWFDESLGRHPPFDVDIVAQDGATLCLNSGLALSSARRLSDVAHTDLIIVPSTMVAGGEWQTGRYPDLVGWLAEMHAAGAELCSACSGALLMAETGLLDGRTATMHWAYAETFRRNFPAVTLRLDRTLVTEGERNEFVMSGTASSWHDLALYLIGRDVGTATAQAVAKFFALDFHMDGMAPYSVFVPRLEHGDAVVQRAQRWAADNLDCTSPVDEMVNQCGIPERSFKRRFRKATGYAPIQYVQELRIDEAKRLLERTKRPVDEIALEVGYGNPAFFRRLFQRKVGITPAAHRRKFNAPADQAHA
ncbi:MAG: helix-turn-helix domain-containing protein [Gammaproteobacteria bacterium]|nr:helix-turn-helix domain-containing protein [Gammaproteobacteria bacterium]NIR82464.1 helix-turn-helix domain-containing protein [Gammaproteobacteria bacterium]NIR88460.1 helix-turn-helix domain-containing protein [Gammaproteobacteria bacterium]NIU03600.1 helix-turn-helix domain-containing protein [Gammaproteobacteria bacterium]NIV50952.1 helix-turn-helix domain-containing protein [Gammaproteobacteria bacterium]